MYVCLSLSLLRCLFASFDGHWTDTELAYMKLSSSLAIYQFSLCFPPFATLSVPISVPRRSACLVSRYFGLYSYVWPLLALLRHFSFISFLFYFISFSLWFLFSGSPIRIVSNKFWLKLPNVGSSISISSRSLALNVIYELGSKKSLIARREKQQRRQRIARKVKAVRRRLNSRYSVNLTSDINKKTDTDLAKK